MWGTIGSAPNEDVLTWCLGGAHDALTTVGVALATTHLC
jgi:hypothetical protein